MASALFLRSTATPEGGPWQARLATVITTQEEAQKIVEFKDTKLLQSVGWKERTGSTRLDSDYVYYSPEGERKRVLPLSVVPGRDMFFTREECLEFVRKEMSAYLSSMNSTRTSRPANGSVAQRGASPVPPTLAPSSIVMVPAPKRPKSGSRPMWPARIMTAQELDDYCAMHNMKRDDDSSVGVVLLCWSGHHTQTAVKREVCKRVLASDLDYMMELFQRGGAPSSPDERLGRLLHSSQTGLDWLAGLAYAKAFADICGQVPIERPIRTDDSTQMFSDEQLDNPWGQQPDPGEEDYVARFPSLAALSTCDQCVNDKTQEGQCDGAHRIGLALYNLARRGFDIPERPPVGELSSSKRKAGSSGEKADAESMRTESSKRVKQAGIDGATTTSPASSETSGVTSPNGPAAAATAKQASSSSRHSNSGVAGDSTKMEVVEEDRATESTRSSSHAASNSTQPPPPPPSRRTPGTSTCTALADNKPSDIDTCARSFRSAWRSLVSVGGCGWKSTPISVALVEPTTDRLLARAAAGEIDVLHDLNLAHEVLVAAACALKEVGRGAVEGKVKELHELEIQIQAALVESSTMLQELGDAGAPSQTQKAGLQEAREVLKLLQAKRNACGGDNGNLEQWWKDAECRVQGLETDYHKIRQMLDGLSVVAREAMTEALEKVKVQMEDARAKRDALRAGRDAQRAIEKLKPLVQKLESRRSLVSVQQDQMQVALHTVRDTWGRLRTRLRSDVCRHTTLLIFDPRCLHHRVPSQHLEQPQRSLEASEAMKALATSHAEAFELHSNIMDSAYFPLYDTTTESYIPEVLRVHTLRHLDCVRQRCEETGSTITRISAPAGRTLTSPIRKGENGGKADGKDDSGAGRSGGGGHGRMSAMGGIEGDTYASRQSWEAASVGFAAALQAVDAVMQGKAKNAFVACRPPGHHAGVDGKPALPPSASEDARKVGWGFCLLNYISGAAKHAVERWGLRRVTVVDIDLHHGNGTEDILSHSAHFQFISVHGANLFPYTGTRCQYPHLVNLPIKGQLTPRKFREVWAEIDKAVDDFMPDLLLVSCGFDGHVMDPIGGLDDWGRPRPCGTLVAEDYGDVIQRLMNLADRHCMGRIVGVMEGGYCCSPGNAGGRKGSLASSSSSASASAAPSASPTRASSNLSSGASGSGGGAAAGGGKKSAHTRSQAKEAAPVEDEGSDQDTSIPADSSHETLKHCVLATCKALAGLDYSAPSSQPWGRI